jgi:hypothetical protein
MEVAALPSEEEPLARIHCEEAGAALKWVRTFWGTEKHESLASAEDPMIR